MARERPPIFITFHALERYYERVLPPGTSLSERDVRIAMTQCIRAGEPLSPMQRRAFAGPRRIAPEDEFIRNNDVIYILRRSKRESLLRCLTVFVATDAQVEMMGEHAAQGHPPVEGPAPAPHATNELVFAAAPAALESPAPQFPATRSAHVYPPLDETLEGIISGLIRFYELHDDAVVEDVYAVFARYPWISQKPGRVLRHALRPLRMTARFQHLTTADYAPFVQWFSARAGWLPLPDDLHSLESES
ncbi:hypothetical protein HY480_00965 [Candidatus Uhrbacteria bacterium]|nr:hypothetical protein [Candidatus Uhrbacteria bacterium]